MATIQPVTSNKPRASTRTSGKGNQWWKRDTFHSYAGDNKTHCGVNAEGWLNMDPMPLREAVANGDFCKRCASVCAVNLA